MASDGERFSFLVEWYDINASLIRRYQLFYFLEDKSFSMYDIKNQRPFLSKSKLDGIKEEDLYIGNVITIMARPLHIVDYGDEYTRKRLGTQKERTLALIKPDAFNKMGQIIDLIYKSGFNVSRLKSFQLTRGDAFEFYAEHETKPFFFDLVQFMMSGPIVAMEIIGNGAVDKWRSMMGPTSCAEARSCAPHSIRARFGTDTTKNAVHGSDSLATAIRELEFFFPSSGPTRPSSATFTDCTCCVIKPHAVTDGLAGAIMSTIQETGFNISAVEMFHLDPRNAEEFLEVYKGVVQEYPQMVKELFAGSCIAIEVRAQDVVKSFRSLCGPADPEIARHLRPRTLRALFGRNKLQNAVHCTDLEEDGLLEVEYFFKILQ